MKHRKVWLPLVFVTMVSCVSQNGDNSDDSEVITPPLKDYSVVISQLGDSLSIPEPSVKLQERYDSIRAIYKLDTVNAENIIWMGRFEAYLGNYNQAFRQFSRGISLYPDDARFYRHRGHRYITVREFDLAINDLEKAKSLIQGQENKVEPDGMPNATGIPVSTLNGNVYYHLGLAYYLKGDWEKALSNYQLCLKSGNLPDNLVSATHWIYMIKRRSGVTKEEAASTLDIISENMDIIENMAYHNTCLLYKGVLTKDELINSENATSANDAILYGLANWYYYNGEQQLAKDVYEDILARKSWNSFGYIAAEVDWLNNFR